nr:hypothetical protein [Tanacetum cinerariifolium]
MIRDALTVGSTMRISLLYHGEYSQWVERFMNYLEEQTDGEAMISSIKNGDQPLPRVTQVSIAGTTSTEQPPLKDKSMWSDQEKRVQKIDLINDLNKCGYSKDNCELNFKFLNNLQPKWKQYAIMMRQNKNLMDINIDALYNILKKNQGDVNDAMGSKKKTIVVTSDPLALIAEKTKLKELIEKNNDLLAQTKLLKEQLQVKHVVIDTHAECQEKYAKLEAERYEYMIRYSAYFDNDKQHRKQIADQEVLYDKMSVQLVELDKHVRDLKNTVLEKNFKIFELEECVRNKDLQIEKCLERLNVCENKLHKMGQTNQTVHMIMPSKDNLYNGRKGIGFENPSYFKKAKDLRPTLYDEKLISLGENKIEFAYDYGNLNASYVNEKINFGDDYFQEIINLDFEMIDSSFQITSSLKQYVPNVILKNIIIDLEDEVVNLLEKEKVNLETIEYLKSKGFESSEKVCSELENQSENDCLVVEKECDKEENPKVISPRMFKLNVSQCVSPISMSKSSCDSKNVEIKLKRKRHLDTFSSVRRPKNSDVIWKKKWPSNTSNVGLSAVSFSKLNKNVKRYYHKDLLACNNSHLGEKSSASVCNDAMNVSCNTRMNDLLDDNKFFIFDDESVRISPVSKMPFRKKHRESMHKRIEKANQQSKDQLQVKHVVIDTHVECHEKYAKLEEERYEYMIRYSELFDNDKQHRKQIVDQEVLFDKMIVELVELDKHNKIEFAYDYGNLNASYVNEKIINPDFEKIDSSFQQTSSLKLYVPNVILEKIIIDLEDEVVSLLEKEKANLKTIESLKSKGCYLLDDNNFFIFDDESVRISPISKMPFRKKPRDSMNVRSSSNVNKSLPRTVHKWLPKMQPLAEPVAKWFPRVKRQIDKISKTPNQGCKNRESLAGRSTTL